MCGRRSGARCPLTSGRAVLQISPEPVAGDDQVAAAFLRLELPLGSLAPEAE
jgi:hypothetical protein